MIGNDIVDLELAKKQSNWRRIGFMEKTFTASEQAMSLSSLVSDQLVWTLWSMKECVYKATRMLDKEILLNPLKFECEMLSASSGKVIYKGMSYHTSTQANKNYVLTETSGEVGQNNIISKVISAKNTDVNSEILYREIESELALRQGWELSHMAIKKNDFGIPQVYYKMKRQEILISLSHHGRFGAYLAIY